MVLNHINCEGYDNSQWGVYGDMEHVSYRELFPVDSWKECLDNFIWLWLDVDERDERFKVTLERNKMLEPDIELLSSRGEGVILIWNLD